MGVALPALQANLHANIENATQYFPIDCHPDPGNAERLHCRRSRQTFMPTSKTQRSTFQSIDIRTQEMPSGCIAGAPGKPSCQHRKRNAILSNRLSSGPRKCRAVALPALQANLHANIENATQYFPIDC